MLAYRLAALCILILVSVSPAYAVTKILTAEATYIMGDGETPSFAEAMALQKAKQSALEEAGTYVQSYTTSVNQDLSNDEIRTIAGGVMQVEILEKTRTLVGNGLRVYTKIRATVTTEKMEELAQRIKGKQIAEEYQKLQVEFARLSREVERSKQRAATTTQGLERQLAFDQIREEERAFAQAQQSEAALFERLVSGDNLMHKARVAKYKVDSLLDIIKNDAHVVEVGEATAHTQQSSERWFPWGNWPLADQVAILTVPVTIRASDTLRRALSETVESLGGMETAATRLQLQYEVPGALAGHIRGIDRRRLSRRVSLYGTSFLSVERASDGLALVPSGNQKLNQYFYREMSTSHAVSRVPVIDFILQEGNHYSCIVPAIVNRILSTHREFDRYGVQLVNWSSIYSTSGSDSAVLLSGPMKFVVEVELSDTKAEQLQGVMGRFEVMQDAPATICRILVDEF